MVVFGTKCVQHTVEGSCITLLNISDTILPKLCSCVVPSGWTLYHAVEYRSYKTAGTSTEKVGNRQLRGDGNGPITFERVGLACDRVVRTVPTLY